jgi:hypothetical protein
VSLPSGFGASLRRAALHWITKISGKFGKPAPAEIDQEAIGDDD